MTIFGSVLPLAVVFRILDMFLLNGMPLLLQVAVALFGISRDFLLLQNYENILLLFSREKLFEKFEKAGSEIVFFQFMSTIKITAKKLLELENKHLASLVSEKHFCNELEKSRTGCILLSKENAILQEKV